MNICILIPSFLPEIGGAEIGAFQLAKYLRQSGHKIAVVTPRLAKKSLKFEIMDGIEIYRFPSFSLPGRLGKALSWRWPFRALLETINVFLPYFYLKSILIQINPDILHMHYVFPLGFSGLYWAKKLDIPTVLTLIGQDIYDPYYIPGKQLHLISKKVMHKVDALTTISTFIKDALVAKFQISAARIEVIPYGVEIERFSPLIKGDEIRNKFGLQNGEKIILTVQRLHVRKGVQFALEAFSEVEKKYTDVKFLIVGDGPEKKVLLRLAEDLAIQDKVIFAGAVENSDLPQYYAAADIFAFHSIYEGFGIVMIEAAASGKPIVTTGSGGSLDIVRNGLNGLLVPAKDSRALADAMMKVLENPELGVSFGRKAREIAEQEFSWDRVSEKYLTIFKRLTRIN
jgi:glycosyltransferase involved in cell wall biosynthesis